MARLAGTARRHVCENSPQGVAVRELVQIATERGRLRADLLEAAAAAELGGWQHSSTSYWAGEQTALLLVAAGADRARVEQLAATTRAHLANASGPGIGHSA